MEYNKVVEVFAQAKFASVPLALSPELQDFIANLDSYETFLQDVDTRYEEMVKESKKHKEDNSLEYQNALNEYNNLIEKYSKKLAEEKVLVGISIEDSEKLDELKKYGVDIDLGDFLKEVQSKTKPITVTKEELEEQKRNIEKMMAFDEKFKYDIPEEERTFGR